MTFSPLLPTALLAENPDEDFSFATPFGHLYCGQKALYHRQLLRTYYLPYSAIVHAFLRCEAFTAKMCCGTYPMDQFHLVLVDSGGKEHQLHLEDQSQGQSLLDFIAQHQPEARIGFYKQQ